MLKYDIPVEGRNKAVYIDAIKNSLGKVLNKVDINDTKDAKVYVKNAANNLDIKHNSSLLQFKDEKDVKIATPIKTDDIHPERRIFIREFPVISRLYKGLFVVWNTHHGDYLNTDTARINKAENINRFKYRNDFFNLVSDDKDNLMMYIHLLEIYFRWMSNMILDHRGHPGYVFLESNPSYTLPIKERITRVTKYIDEKYSMVSNNKKLFEITKAYVNNNIPEDYDAISIIDIKVKGISSEEIIMNKILTAKGIKLLAKPGYFRIRGIRRQSRIFYFQYTTESKLQQKIIIEIDGQQHFKSVFIFDGLQGFDRRIEDDILKTNTALKLGYRVFRFSQLTEPKLIKNLDIALNSEELFWCDNPDIYKHIISELPRFK